MTVLEEILNIVYEKTTIEFYPTEVGELGLALQPLADELQELRDMVEWMEQNSNGSLCDYYNRD